MARHWSGFVAGLSEKQAAALDKMAEAHGLGNGMDLLMRLTGCSSSKVGEDGPPQLCTAVHRPGVFDIRS